MPPLSVTMAAARRITGTQSGEVISATSTSPSRNWSSSAGERRMRARPLARPGEPARPVSRGVAAAVPPRPAPGDAPAAHGADRPGLHQVGLAGLHRPFHVLRRAVVVLDPDGQAGELDSLLV